MLQRCLTHTSRVSMIPMYRLASIAPSRMMGGGGHDSTLEPPFHRLPLPNRPLPEEDELIWNDRVAPETALDFDAPHIDSHTGLLMWLGGFGFFYAIYLFADSTSHPSKKPTVRLFSRTLPRPPPPSPPHYILACVFLNFPRCCPHLSHLNVINSAAQAQ